MQKTIKKLTQIKYSRNNSFSQNEKKKALSFSCSSFALKPIFEPKKTNIIKANNTAKLLDLLHNGKEKDSDLHFEQPNFSAVFLLQIITYLK